MKSSPADKKEVRYVEIILTAKREQPWDPMIPVMMFPGGDLLTHWMLPGNTITLNGADYGRKNRDISPCMLFGLIGKYSVTLYPNTTTVEYRLSGCDEWSRGLQFKIIWPNGRFYPLSLPAAQLITGWQTLLRVAEHDPGEGFFVTKLWYSKYKKEDFLHQFQPIKINVS